jgi:hypothetical protein
MEASERLEALMEEECAVIRQMVGLGECEGKENGLKLEPASFHGEVNRKYTPGPRKRGPRSEELRSRVKRISFFVEGKAA